MSREIDFNLTDGLINRIKDVSLVKSQIQVASVQTNNFHNASNTNISSLIGILEKVFSNDLLNSLNTPSALHSTDTKIMMAPTTLITTTIKLTESTNEETDIPVLTYEATPISGTEILTTNIMEKAYEVTETPTSETKIETTSKIMERTLETSEMLTSDSKILTSPSKNDTEKTIITTTRLIDFDIPVFTNSRILSSDEIGITNSTDNILKNTEPKISIEPTEKRQVSNLKMSKKFKALVKNILKHSKEN